MYKLLIVEDEKWEREGIYGFLDWESLGIEVSGCASNGIEGIKMAEIIRPDIIITDIKMPLMDGIQMSREIRSFLPETHIIILSGYGDFEYAKQTFDFHAFAYLLKPIQKNSIQETILKVIKKLEDKKKHHKERVALENQWLEYTNKNRDYLLLDFLNQKTDLMYINDPLLLKRFKTHKDKVVAVFSISLNPNKTIYEDSLNAETIQNVLTAFDAMLETRGIALTCSEHMNEAIICMDAPSTKQELENVLLQMVEELRVKTGVYCIVGIGETVDELELIPVSFKQARKALGFRFLVNYGELLFYSDIMDSEKKNWDLTRQLVEKVDLISKKIVNHIQKGDINQGICYVDEFIENLKQYPSESKILLNCFIMNIINELNMILPNNTDGVYLALFNPQKGMVDYSLLGSILQTKKYLTGFLSRIAVNMEKDCCEGNVARMVLKIIEERYSEDLNLKRISEEVHLYPYYIGSIFKEYTGKHFNQFLNDYRIDKAKEILDTNCMKISDLAKAVGIPNSSYFCCLFKKKLGINPGEYKEIMSRRHKSV